MVILYVDNSVTVSSKQVLEIKEERLKASFAQEKKACWKCADIIERR